MGLDIRIPLGLIFLIIGGLMSVYGFFSRHSAVYDKSMGINLNLTWGALMFVFGLIMYFAGRRQKWQDDPVTPRPGARSKGPLSTLIAGSSCDSSQICHQSQSLNSPTLLRIASHDQHHCSLRTMGRKTL